MPKKDKLTAKDCIRCGSAPRTSVASKKVHTVCIRCYKCKDNRVVHMSKDLDGILVSCVKTWNSRNSKISIRKLRGKR